MVAIRVAVYVFYQGKQVTQVVGRYQENMSYYVFFLFHRMQVQCVVFFQSY